MEKDNIIRDKSFCFAIRAVNLYKYLSAEKSEFVLSKQLLRSATSIGANVEEAIGGQSEKDFLAKISIAYKEARETRYWVQLLQATEYLTTEEADSLLRDIDDIISILIAIQKTMKNRLKI